MPHDSHEREQVFREGLVTTALVAIGGRPFRVFLMGWMAILAVWLALVFTNGLGRTGTAGRPPAPEGIPYAIYPGLGIPSDRVPSHDPTLLPKDARVWLENTGTRPRLLVITGSGGSLGWPRSFLLWNRAEAWDVSDPNKPFAPASSMHWSKENSISSVGFQQTFISEDGSSHLRVSASTTALWPLIAVQLPSAVIAFVAFFWLRRRQRRRRSRCECLICGQGLDPIVHPSRCTECGSVVPPHPDYRRAPCLFSPTTQRTVTLWLLFIASLILIFARLPRDHAIDSLEHQLSQRAEFVGDRDAQPQDDPRSMGFRIARRDYGWPWPAIKMEDIRWFEVATGQAPQPVSADQFAGFDFDEFGQARWTSVGNDPSLMRCVSLDWRAVLLYILIAELLAAIVLGLSFIVKTGWRLLHPATN